MVEPQLSVGELWRDVLNYLGDRPVSPEGYLPLADAVLPKWARWTYFLGHAAASLTRDRAELEADAARAHLGWRIWTERREDLRAYAQSATRRRVDDELLQGWWILDAGGELWAADISTHGGGDKKRADDFRRRLRLTEEDEQILRFHPDMPEPYLDYWLLTWLRWNLRWADDLEKLRRLARKTWPAEPGERQHWTSEELQFVNWYFEEQQPYLISPEEDRIDPFELEVSNGEQGIGFGMDGLRYLMYVFLRAVVIDFVDEILDRTRRPTARGSLSCIECGRFVGRRALGYGQLYCSDRCKKRAAKRRYRKRVPSNSEVLSPAPIGVRSVP